MASDKVAIALAEKIINFQQRVAARLNNWFNNYSVNQKKGILIISCALFASVLISGAFSSFYGMPLLSQNYSSAHIGQASDIPKIPKEKSQITDSLTKKKVNHGNNF